MSRRYLPVVALGLLSLLFLTGVADLAYGIVVGMRVHLSDITVLEWITANRIGWLTTLMDAYTHVGDDLVAAVLVAATCAWLWWAAKRHEYAVFLLSVTASAAIVNYGLKVLIDRTRPAAMLAVAPIPHTPSFPSGHALIGITFFGGLALLAMVEWGWKRGLLPAVALVALGATLGMSRAYIGVHWMSDVLGGWLLGLAWLSGASAIWLWIVIRRWEHTVSARPATDEAAPRAEP